MKKVVLNVNGMSCSHCESSIKNSLLSLEGINEVNVNINNKTVEVTYEGISLEIIKDTIEDQGYDTL